MSDEKLTQTNIPLTYSQWAGLFSSDPKYQANTIKDQNILSAIYLELRVASDRRLQFKLNELNDIAGKLVETISGHRDGW